MPELDGFPTDNYVPKFAIQAHFAQGEASAPSASRAVAYAGPMLAGGTATPGQLIRATSATHAKSLAGAGSALHRAAKMHFNINKSGEVYLLPHADSAGTAADVDLTIAGTASAAAQLKVWICGELVAVSVSSGDTPTEIAAALVAKVNGREHLPCTAAAVAGLVTLTSKHAAASQGDGTTGSIRVRTAITSGATTAITPAACAVGDTVPGADGGTTEAAALTAVLANIANTNRYYVVPTHTTAASVAAVDAHVTEKNTAGVGLRCVGIFGYTGTAASAQALALTPNSELLSLGCQQNSDRTTEELAAFLAATRQKAEQGATHKCANMTGESSPYVTGPADESDKFSPTELNDMIKDGVTPIGSNGEIVRYVTTYSKAASVDDRRAADVHKVSTIHDFMDRAAVKYLTTYKGFFLKDDERLPDGAVNLAQKIYKKVLTPSLFRPFWNKHVNEYADRFQDATAIKESMSISISSENSSRIVVELNPSVVDIAAQAGVAVNEVSS